MSQPETGTDVSIEVEEGPSAPTLAMIARAASDPNVSVEKMVALEQLHERMIDRAAKEAYMRAFSAAMMEMPTITKNGAIKNNSGQVQSRFSKWEDVDRVVRPILKRHGLVMTFKIGEAPNKALSVCAVLIHVGGHAEEGGFMPLPVDASGNKNPVQGTGSAMSYGKRYTTIAMLNIITEGSDDDGRGGEPTGEDASDAQRLWVEEAKIAARKGVAAYAEHFAKLPRAAKLYLTNSGEHEKLKSNAEIADQQGGPTR